MKTIQLLPSYLIAQIAAGEIIERPAYAVKELLDNAIDAKATQITIELVDSGLSKIIVTDNGIGMNKEDLLESYKLHTTSKVHDQDTLLAIKTLGFRGEALASIAAISTLIVESKPKNKTIGTKISLEYGTLAETTSLGMPSGTRIIVENLFGNVPARKNFLKSKRTELRRIIQIISQYSLAAPETQIRFSHEGKTLLDFPAATLAEHIQILFRDIPPSSLLPVIVSDTYIHINGFIGTPQLSSQIIAKQYLSVNNRPIVDKVVTSTIKDAYGVLLPQGTQPTFFLNVRLPFETVDVNVHPRKEEVNFVDEQLLNDVISNAVQQTLSVHNLTFHSVQWQKSTNYQSITQSHLGKKLKEKVMPWNTSWLGKIAEQDTLVQVHNLYIVAPSKNGFVVVDQHAAHERILYEKFQQQLLNETEQSNSHQLQTPVLLEFSVSEAEILLDHQPHLEQIGFQLESFHGSTWRITHIPTVAIDRDIPGLLKEMISDHRTIGSENKKMLALLACKSAVKSGDPLTHEQMKDLLLELEKIPHAVTCPHGRPVKWEISLHELNKLFKRS